MESVMRDVDLKRKRKPDGPANSIVQGRRIRVVPITVAHCYLGNGTYTCERYLYTVPMIRVPTIPYQQYLGYIEAIFPTPPGGKNKPPHSTILPQSQSVPSPPLPVLYISDSAHRPRPPLPIELAPTLLLEVARAERNKAPGIKTPVAVMSAFQAVSQVQESRQR